MWIEEVHLRQYRNYTHLDLEPVPHKNLFIGENAAGKTNILESIYFISHGKSQRTRHDRELIQWEAPFATIQVKARSHHHGGSVLFESFLTITPQNTLKTLFKLDGNPLKSRSEMVGKLPSVTFFLSDLAMLRGAPDDRRNAVDSALVQFEPIHFQRLSQYQRVRQQKSQLLKQPPHLIDPGVLDSLNMQLAAAGAQVIQARVSYLKQVEALAEVRYLELSRGKEQLSIRYQPSFGELSDTETLETIENRLLETIRAHQSDECRRGQVLYGPHRDDVRFYLNGRDACQFGSQGQQRTIVLAFKLSEITILSHRHHQDMPVLLLDDVMAQLDPGRQHELLAHLDPQMQVFLTTTHLDSELQWFLNGSASARIFTVQNGGLTWEEKEQVQYDESFS